MRALLKGRWWVVATALVLAGAAIAATAIATARDDHGGGLEVSAFPLPGTPTASPDTQISFRGAPPALLRTIKVTGSRTGEHAGRWRPDPDGSGASFIPDEPFAPGEDVTVRAGFRIAGTGGHQMQFLVAREAPPAPPAQAASDEPAPKPAPAHRYRSRPDLRPPVLTVTTPARDTAKGDVLLAPKRGAGQIGPMIVDGSGEPVWFHPLPDGQSADDFRVQTYRGRPVLTWWQGPTWKVGHGEGEGIVADSSYRIIKRVRAGNGYRTDLHEFQLTPRGTAIFTIYHPVAWDLSPVGGPRDGAVLDSIVQEVDLRTGLVLFEWHSLGHVPVSESNEPLPHEPREPYDYFHVNSVDVGPSGDLLISARHTSTVYDVDRRTGRIVWRLGGEHSDFALPDDATFDLQHHARWQEDGRLRLFDNDSKDGRGHSRVEVLALDAVDRTATLVRAFDQPHGRLAETQGDAQRLPNGDLFVGWGSLGEVSELGPGGDLRFDAQLPEGYDTYRAYRFPWTGRPAGRPALAVGDGAAYVSWNGATGVARWQLLTGSGPNALRRAGTTPRSGFETRIALPRGARWIAVRALDARGRVLGRTAPEPVS